MNGVMLLADGDGSTTTVRHDNSMCNKNVYVLPDLSTVLRIAYYDMHHCLTFPTLGMYNRDL